MLEVLQFFMSFSHYAFSCCFIFLMVKELVLIHPLLTYFFKLFVPFSLVFLVTQRLMRF